MLKESKTLFPLAKKERENLLDDHVGVGARTQKQKGTQKLNLNGKIFGVGVGGKMIRPQESAKRYKSQNFPGKDIFRNSRYLNSLKKGKVKLKKNQNWENFLRGGIHLKGEAIKRQKILKENLILEEKVGNKILNLTFERMAKFFPGFF
ncbi:MAG: hypothetical protein CM15mP88_2500 [Pseudomonadota bacterium]|nr:MAG: hypothetical protein CM15mP88_2500 [Pseudomonadota bacterium]